MKFIVILGLISFANLVYGRVCPDCVELTQGEEFVTGEALLRQTLIKLAASDEGPKYEVEKVFMVTVALDGTYIVEAELLDDKENKKRCEVVFYFPEEAKFKVNFECTNEKTLERYVNY